MTESFDPPIEWVAGSRWGLVWVIGSILAIYILTALFFLALAGWIMQGLPRFLTGLPELGCLVIGLINLYATLSRPMNLRIGLTPVALVVRGPLHATAFPWQNVYPTSGNAFLTGSPGTLGTGKIVLTSAQAKRVHDFLRAGTH
ncbi:MAG: hypothetical protein WCA77_02530 [Thermoplasmata archaeon]